MRERKEKERPGESRAMEAGISKWARVKSNLANFRLVLNKDLNLVLKNRGSSRDYPVNEIVLV